MMMAASRLYQLVTLFLLCATNFQVRAFVSPQRRLIYPHNRLESTGSSNLRATVDHTKSDPGIVHQEKKSASSDNFATLSSRENVTGLMARFPAFLMLLALLSTKQQLMRTTALMGKKSSPAWLASTFVNRVTAQFSQRLAPLSLTVGSIFLVLFQQSNVHQSLALVSILLKQLGALYMTSLAAFPCITKSVTSGIIGFLGDFMAQSLERRLKKAKDDDASSIITHGTYDLRRGLGIMADGFFVSGPLMHMGYDLFEQILPIHGVRGHSSLAALTHVVADSFILDSIFVATSFLVTGITEGYGFRKHVIPQFKRDYVPIVKAGWTTSFILMPLEFVCFRFLPVTMRTLAMNFTDVVWDGIVSFMTHRNRDKRDRIDGVIEATSININTAKASVV